jgi:hypothetical protein
MKVAKKELPKKLMPGCCPEWSNIKWPKTATTMLAVFGDEALIIGHHLYGWPAGKRKGWYVHSILTEYKLSPGLYFAKMCQMEPKDAAINIARQIQKEL